MAFEQGGVWSCFSISASVALKVSTYYRWQCCVCSSGGIKLSCAFKDLPSGSSYTTCRNGSVLSSWAWLRLFKPGRGSYYHIHIQGTYVSCRLKKQFFWMDRESGGGGGENLIDQLSGRKDRKYMWTVYITTFWLIQEALPKILRYKEFFQQS